MEVKSKKPHKEGARAVRRRGKGNLMRQMHSGGKIMYNGSVSEEIKVAI